MAYVRKDQETIEEVAASTSRRMMGKEVQVEGLESEERIVRLEDVVGKVLRWGSLLSMSIILAGLAGVAWSAHMATGPQLLLVPVVGTQETVNPASLAARLATGDATAIISLGLFVLIVTPVLRVASTVIYFFVKRDLTYFLVTGFVLLVLIAGFLLGSTAG